MNTPSALATLTILALTVSWPLYAAEKVVSLKGQSLEIQAASAKITVEPGERNEVRLTMRGEQKALDAIRATEEGGKVVLKESGGHSKGTISSNVQVNGDVIVQGGSVTIGGVTMGDGKHSASQPSELLVQIARTMPLSIKSSGAEVTIGKLEAPLKLELNGFGDVQVGAVRDGDVAALGTGNVTIDTITGNLKIRSDGTGDITVQKGKISKLAIDLRGTGNVTVESPVAQASIRMDGTGSVTLHSAERHSIESRTGLGTLEIGGVEY